MKKYMPLRELLVSSIVFLFVLVFIEYLSLDMEVEIGKKIILNLSLITLYIIIYIVPVMFLFNNYREYISKRKIDYNEIEENNVDRIVLIGTQDKIKDRPSVYSLAYQMSFFYIKIYLKGSNKPILVTSLDEYKLENWVKYQFPNIEIEKQIEYFPKIGVMFQS